MGDPQISYNTMNRRHLLSCLVGGAFGAGCLDTGARSGGGAVDESAYDVSPFPPALVPQPSLPERHPVAIHVRSHSAAQQAFDTEPLSEPAQSHAETFLEATNFEEETLYYVQTRAPDSCYGIRVTALEWQTATELTGAIISEDHSEPDEECATVVTTPSVLLRVRGDPNPPAQATFDVTDGWEETETVTTIQVDA